ncbi:glycosyltransferase [Propionicicella superfundia]|uniref:glycosyltransferase n=1 Tax=Propionicicella superfundia TaxID=348582 RepID=UPI0003FFF241|nr:glycosyltransferase [Propionicicella superfundia]
MKVTLVSYGSTGDALPLVALAAGLDAAGHRVVTVGDQAGAGLAARHGLEFHALAGSFQELMEPGRPAALAVEAGHFTWKSLRDYDAHDRARLALIQKVARGSDVVVAMPTAHYHALAVARDIGARPVLAVLQPLAPTHAMTPAGAGLPSLPRVLRRPAGRLVQRAGWLNAKGPLNDARRALGQAPVEDPTRDAFTLCAWSPTLVPHPDDWPTSRFAITGRWHLPTRHGEPDPALDAFLDAGEPPVYVGFGSMQGFTGMHRLLDALFAGLAPRRIVLACGSGTPSDEDLPAGVHRVAGFVPHDWLFPRCAAIVHHCGAGTAHQAVAAGVPSIPVPISMDQPFWADRLHRLGVASAPLNPRKPGVELVRRAVAAAESRPVRRHAAELARRTADEDGIAAAIRQIERLGH